MGGDERPEPEAQVRTPVRSAGWIAVRGALARLGRATTDLLLPPVCRCCNSPLAVDHAVCAACWRQVRFITPPLCDRLGIPLPFDTGERQVSAAALVQPPLYHRARAVGLYTGPLRDLIHDLKFHDRIDQRRLLARWMLAAGTDLIAAADLIVPVPLARLRLLQRRYNQAALLAEEIARASGRAVDPLALARIKPTRPQVGLSEVQRQLNVRAAFRVPAGHRAAVSGRRILLIDDVITTGATVNACTRALLRAGATHVDVLAVALVHHGSG
jgi:ComF family protein